MEPCSLYKCPPAAFAARWAFTGVEVGIRKVVGERAGWDIMTGLRSDRASYDGVADCAAQLSVRDDSTASQLETHDAPA